MRVGLSVCKILASLSMLMRIVAHCPDTIISSVIVPVPGANDRIGSFKTAIRPMNSHAWVNAAFKFNVAEGKIANAICAFGGVMEPDAKGSHAVRASQTEEFLSGKAVSKQTLEGALKTLTGELQPAGSTRSEFRSRLIIADFYKFFIRLLK